MSHTGPAITQADATKRDLEITTLPLLPPTEDSYVVRVRAAAACRDELGWEVADPHLFMHRPQRVPGPEGAGVILSAPQGAPFIDGDKIMWSLDAWESGSMRAFTSVPVAAAARVPKQLTWSEAAAVPLSALTAWQGLFEHGILESTLGTTGASSSNSGKRVLVTGASGSVGLWALRLGAAAGAMMIGIGSGARAAEMTANGATEVIDYRTQSVAHWSKNNKVEQVLDCTGKDQADVWGALKDGGTFLGIATDPVATRPKDKPATAKWYLVRTRAPELARIADLIDEWGWKPAIDSVHPFDAFREAYERVDGAAAGKVVITVSEESAGE